MKQADFICAFEKAGAKRIRRINLVIGEISGIVDASVQFYFDFISKDSPAEGATLVMERKPARFQGSRDRSPPPG